MSHLVIIEYVDLTFVVVGISGYTLWHGAVHLEIVGEFIEEFITYKPSPLQGGVDVLCRYGRLGVLHVFS